MVLDININLNSIFNCIPATPTKVNLEVLKESFKGLPQETQIKIILTRLLNGSFDAVWLNDISNRENLTNIYHLGSFDNSKTIKIKTWLIPIYTNGSLKYSLVLASRKKLGNYNKQLVELLANILRGNLKQVFLKIIYKF